MGVIVDRWRRIGTRLYLALGFAVLLTLVSSAVGVLYFERSGDLNYQVESESVPALEASWDAAREAERLRSLGLELQAAPDIGAGAALSGSVEESLAKLEDALTNARRIPDLEAQALVVQEAAYDLVDVIDGLAFNRTAMLEANDEVAACGCEWRQSRRILKHLSRAFGCLGVLCEPRIRPNWTACGETF